MQFAHQKPCFKIPSLFRAKKGLIGRIIPSWCQFRAFKALKSRVKPSFCRFQNVQNFPTFRPKFSVKSLHSQIEISSLLDFAKFPHSVFAVLKVPWHQKSFFQHFTGQPRHFARIFTDSTNFLGCRIAAKLAWYLCPLSYNPRSFRTY